MTEQFFTILTAIGKAKIANAAALGNKVELTELALGDGGGSYYNPTENQTELRNEVWRGAIGTVDVDTENPHWITIQTVVPSQHGGFMIREAGVFDNEGDLIAVGKYPETYKPVAADGSIKDLVIRMILEVSNAASVVLKVDPTVILATQQQVDAAEARAKAYTDQGVAEISQALDAHKAAAAPHSGHETPADAQAKADAAEARAKAYTNQEIAEVSQALDAHSAQLANKLDKSGGTMTGPLILAGDPTDPMHAATKQYADRNTSSELTELVRCTSSRIFDPNQYPSKNGIYVVVIQGAGGGGGEGDNSSFTEHVGSGGGGGGGGGYVVYTFSHDYNSGKTYPVVVGAGGKGGGTYSVFSDTHHGGQGGGYSAFEFIQAPGGGGGCAGWTSGPQSIWAGTDGGKGSYVNTPAGVGGTTARKNGTGSQFGGTDGESGKSPSGTTGGSGGKGGNSAFGTGGNGGSGGAEGVKGQNGTSGGIGAGGGGGGGGGLGYHSGGKGGNGGSGIVIIYGYPV